MDEGGAGPLPAAVITVSDEVAAGTDTDRGGPVAVGLLQELGLSVTSALVGDDPAAIRGAIVAATAAGARVVVTCGGTGLGPRDNTTAVVRDLVSFEIPGIAEEIRRRGLQHTPQALVSREVAGAIVRQDRPSVFVLAAPGSRGGVRDALGVVGESLRYIIDQLDGAGHA